MDRSTLVTMTLSSDEFADTLCEKLITLRAHAFIATQQSRFFEECKQSLETGEVVVCADSQKTMLLFYKMRHKGSIGTTVNVLYTLL